MRHTSRQLQPVRQDITDLDTLTSMSQEGADPPDNDVRQTQRNQLEYENVVVDVIKCLSEVDEECVPTGPCRQQRTSDVACRPRRASLNVA